MEIFLVGVKINIIKFVVKKQNKLVLIIIKIINKKEKPFKINIKNIKSISCGNEHSAAISI